MHDDNEGVTRPKQPTPAGQPRDLEAPETEAKRDRGGRGGSARTVAGRVPLPARLKRVSGTVGGVLSALVLIAAGGGLVAASALSP